MNKLRSMTDAEVAALEYALAERSALSAEARLEYKTPSEANDSLAGAVYWALARMKQDKPLILAAGVVLLTVQLGLMVLTVFN